MMLYFIIIVSLVCNVTLVVSLVLLMQKYKELEFTFIPITRDFSRSNFLKKILLLTDKIMEVSHGDAEILKTFDIWLKDNGGIIYKHVYIRGGKDTFEDQELEAFNIFIEGLQDNLLGKIAKEYNSKCDRMTSKIETLSKFTIPSQKRDLLIPSSMPYENRPCGDRH